MTPPRLPALVAFAVLGVAVLALIVLTTPWHPLGAHAPHVATDPHRDFTAAEFDREVAFHRAVRPPAYVSFALGLVAAGVLGLTRTGARVVGAIPGPWPVKAGLGALALTVLPVVVTLPFDARAEMVLRRYGLSTQTWSSWALDEAKGALVGGVVVVVAMVGLVGIARAAPRTWWAWGGLAAAALVCVASYVYPVVVEPLFNKFTPLEAGQLRSDLLDLARRDGLPVHQVLVADASRRTTALNAYVSGYGRTRRIVLYDTLLKQTTPREVELVVAHELGHVKHHDVRTGTLLGALGAAAAVSGLYLLLTWRPLLDRSGADGARDPKVVGLLLFLAAAAGFVSSPLQNIVSRHIEARADVHSLDLTGDVDTFVTSEHTLAVTNLSDLDPNPAVYALFFDHPTSPQRIALARAWAAR